MLNDIGAQIPDSFISYGALFAYLAHDTVSILE